MKENGLASKNKAVDVGQALLTDVGKYARVHAVNVC